MIQTLKDFDRNRFVTLKIISADPLIKLKKYAETFTELGPGIDANGYPVTGLTEDKHWKTDKGGTKVTRGTRLIMEQELDMVEGSLKQNAAFWITYSIKIGSDDINLDLRNGYDLLKYLFAHAQTVVANSIKEIETNSKAEFVLFSKEQESETKVVSRNHLKKAYALADSLDLETKMNILNVYGFIVESSQVNTIENKLMEELEKDPKAFLKMAEDDNLVYRSLITKALDKGIFELKEGGIYHGEIVVGYDKTEAAKSLAKDLKLVAVVKAKLTGDMDLIKSALTKQS